MLVRKQGLSLKQRGKIYQCCVRPVLLRCCETWEFTVAHEVSLPGVGRWMIRMMCGVRLADRVLADVLQVKVDGMVMVWSCHAWRHQFPNTELEITGKRRRNNISTRTTDLVEYCVKFFGILAFKHGGRNYLSAAECPIIY